MAILTNCNPLAPFLFLVVAEGFNLLMSKVVSFGFFKGLTMGGLLAILAPYTSDKS
jgi:hypothetical protein